MKKMRKNRIGIFLAVLCMIWTVGCGKVSDGTDYDTDVRTEPGDTGYEETETEKSAAEEIPEASVESNGEYICYGYETLNEEQKTIYRQLLQGILEYQDTVTVSSCTEDDINKANNMVFADHPELFWLDQQYYIFEQEQTGLERAELSLVYNMEKEEIDTVRQQVEEKADQWLAGVPSEAGVYEKIRYIYELLSQNVAYDTNSPDNQNIKSVFLGQSTVCMGFAKATQYMLGKMGLFCTLVTGTAAPDDEGHAWNLVKIDGNYYHLDTTWASPGFAKEEENAVNEISYAYLCCNDDTLFATHTPDDSMPLPPCTDDSYNYYKLNGSWYDTYDEDVVYQVLADSIVSGVKKTDFKFASWDGYAQAVAAMAEGNLVERAVQDYYPFQEGESYSWNVGYIDEERILSVYW